MYQIVFENASNKIQHWEDLDQHVVKHINIHNGHMINNFIIGQSLRFTLF